MTANVFMSDDDSAFYKAWNAVMGPLETQLLCTWLVFKLEQKFKQNAMQLKKKKTIVFKTLKALLYETIEHNSYIEL